MITQSLVSCAVVGCVVGYKCEIIFCSLEEFNSGQRKQMLWNANSREGKHFHWKELNVFCAIWMFFVSSERIHYRINFDISLPLCDWKSMRTLLKMTQPWLIIDLGKYNKSLLDIRVNYKYIRMAHNWQCQYNQML